MPYTNGFETDFFTDHFDKHHTDFGCSTEEEYKSMADEFCGGAMDAQNQKRANNRISLKNSRNLSKKIVSIPKKEIDKQEKIYKVQKEKERARN